MSDALDNDVIDSNTDRINYLEEQLEVMRTWIFGLKIFCVLMIATVGGAVVLYSSLLDKLNKQNRLQLMSLDLQNRGEMKVDSIATRTISVCDSQGLSRLMIGYSPDDQPGLRLTGKHGGLAQFGVDGLKSEESAFVRLGTGGSNNIVMETNVLNSNLIVGLPKGFHVFTEPSGASIVYVRPSSGKNGLRIITKNGADPNINYDATNGSNAVFKASTADGP